VKPCRFGYRLGSRWRFVEVFFEIGLRNESPLLSNSPRQGITRSGGSGTYKRSVDKSWASPYELTEFTFTADELGKHLGFSGRAIRDWVSTSCTEDGPNGSYKLLCDRKGKIYRDHAGTRFAILNKGGKGRSNNVTFCSVRPGGLGQIWDVPSSLNFRSYFSL
jgi:hypothetical protein